MRLARLALAAAALALGAPAAAAANTYDVALPGSHDPVTAPDGLWFSELRWESESASATEGVDARSGDGAWVTAFSSGAPHGRRWNATALPQGSRAVRVTGDAVVVHALRPRLVDEHPATATAIRGSLTTPGAKRGAVSVTASLVDRGSGLRYVKLGVDGRFHSWNMRLVDPNGGMCTESGAPYAALAPCVAAAEDTATLDTTAIADGHHEIEYLLQDAAGNLTTAATWTITVNNPGGALPDTACANGVDDDGDGATDAGADAGCASAEDESETHAPVATAPPLVFGDAVAGATVGSIGAVWDDGPGAGAATARRWQLCDGAGCADIPDAGGPELVITAAAAGRRIRLVEERVTSEGRARIESAMTAPVTVPPEPTPEAPPQPAPDPAPAPRVAILELDDGCGAVLTGRRSTIGGRLRDQHGVPFAGVTAQVDERRVGADSSDPWRPMRLARPVTTDADGRFTLVPTAKASHAIRVSWGAASCAVSVVVRASASIAADRTRGGAVITGRVGGGLVPRGGVRVAVQARGARGWRVVRRLSTNERGAFATTYRGALRELRVAVEATPGYPFAPAVSRTVKAR